MAPRDSSAMQKMIPNVAPAALRQPRLLEREAQVLALSRLLLAAVSTSRHHVEELLHILRSGCEELLALVHAHAGEVDVHGLFEAPVQKKLKENNTWASMIPYLASDTLA